MAKLRCKGKEGNKVCNCTYFEVVKVNEFHDLSTNLTTGLREVEVDSHIKMYKCIRCGTMSLPPIEYYNSSEDDKKLYLKLQSYLDGEEVELDKKNSVHRTQPGHVDFMKSSTKDNPKNHGKFIRN